MIRVKPFENLGHVALDWLDTHHHFSFAKYTNPDDPHFGALRVLNDDEIKEGFGFRNHAHRNMEIITYVRHGEISHKNSKGKTIKVKAGEVQVISAGDGIVHTEFNKARRNSEIFQFWVKPSSKTKKTDYSHMKFKNGEGKLELLVSGRKKWGSLYMNQDAEFFGSRLNKGDVVTHWLKSGRSAYLVSSYGELIVNGSPVKARDGVAITNEREISIRAEDESEFFLLDLP